MFTARIKGTELFIHILSWVLFISLEMSVLAHIMGKVLHPFQYLIYYAINIAVFYTEVSVLNGLKQDLANFFKIGVVFLAFIAFFFFLKSAVTYLFEAHYDLYKPMAIVRRYFVENLSRTLYFAILAIFYWSAGHVNRYRIAKLMAEKELLLTEKERAELAIDLSRAQNAYYQQQVHPHLFFNVLNYIYDKTYRISADSGRSVLLLADLMRYSLEPAGADNKLPLSSETGQIRNLIELTRFRFENDIYVTFTDRVSSSSLRVLPLVMITLAENVLKHGVVNDPLAPAEITISDKEDGSIVFETKNRKKLNNAREGKMSQGLHNVRIRLEQAYGAHHSLTIDDRDGEFSVKLIFPG